MFALGANLAEWARQSAQDDVSRATFSIVHTALCMGAAIQTYRTLTFSVQRTIHDVNAVAPQLLGRFQTDRQAA